MIIDPTLADVNPLRAALRADIRADETAIVRRLAAEAALPKDARERVALRARALVEEVRRARVGKGGLDAFLHEFGLTSKEGVVLMCLAEALLRVPDAETVDRLIKDKLAEADWRGHLGHSASLFVNASTWALMMTGRVVRLDAADTRDLAGTLKRLVRNSGEPMIRGGITQ
ncbi:MAG: bifunctional proline dehydrogenase/L-glutamate gamma-semialdehyde dehydrogenase, partial [Alphaproteobacteria bacterium]